MPRADWDRLMRRAAGRHGVFTAAEAAACDVSSSRLTRELRRGRIRRAHRGVFTVAGSPATWEQRAMAAVLASGGRGLLCRTAAAYVHGLFDARPPARISLLVPRGAHVTVRGVDVHRSIRLGDDDRAVVRGLLVTTIERTICDLSPVLAPRRLRAVILHAWRRGWTSPDAIAHCRARLAGAARSVALTETLDSLDPTLAHTRSVEEAEAFLALEAAGLPPPRINHRIPGAGSWRWFELDLAYDEVRLAIEVDGRLTHSVRDDVERDRLRQRLIEERGWTVLRVSGWEVRNRPDRFVARVRAALRELGHPAVS